MLFASTNLQFLYHIQLYFLTVVTFANLRMQLPVNLIEEELKIFEDKFKEAVTSNVPMLDRIMRYIVKRKGKATAPDVCFFISKTLWNVNESTYRAASLVELLHTATLGT